MDSPTFVSFLDPKGIIVAAALITGFIQILKGVFPKVDQLVSGALLAFVLSLVVYLLTGWVTGVPTPDAGLTLFAAWLSCATASVGAYATIKHAATPSG